MDIVELFFVYVGGFFLGACLLGIATILLMNVVCSILCLLGLMPRHWMLLLYGTRRCSARMVWKKTLDRPTPIL